MNHEGDNIGAAVAGGFGGLVEWLRSGKGPKQLAFRIGAGVLCAVVANAALRKHSPDLEYDFRWGICGLVGVGGAIIIEWVLKQYSRLAARGDQILDQRVGPVPNGRPNPAPGPNGPAATPDHLAEGGAGHGVGGNSLVPGDGVGSEGAAKGDGQRTEGVEKGGTQRNEGTAGGGPAITG